MRVKTALAQTMWEHMPWVEFSVLAKMLEEGKKQRTAMLQGKAPMNYEAIDEGQRGTFEDFLMGVVRTFNEQIIDRIDENESTYMINEIEGKDQGVQFGEHE